MSASSQKRHERSKERVEKRRRSDCASALLELFNQSTEEKSHLNASCPSDVEESRSKDCQTEVTNEYIAGLEKENSFLKEQLKLNSLNGDHLERTMTRFCFTLAFQIGHCCCVYLIL